MSGLTGGCLCGKLRFTLKTAPTQVVLCHCTNCQKTSGSAFATSALSSDDDIAFEGEMASYESVGETGNTSTRYFCANCGCSIGNRSAKRPGMFILKVGTLDDHSTLQTVLAQIWTRSKQPWVKFAFETPEAERGM